MPAAPQPLTATHARRAAALAALSAVLVLVACLVISWWVLGRFTSGHPMSDDDVITVAFAVIAALALARLGAICLLSSRDLWSQAGMDERRPAPAEGSRRLSTSAPAGEDRPTVGSRSRSRARAASVFLAIAAFSGIAASSAGAATLPTSTSSTQALPGTSAPSAPATTVQDASSLPTTSSAADEAPSPDFATPSETAASAVSDAPSPDASSSGTPSSGTPSSDAPSPDVLSSPQPSSSTQSPQTHVPSTESAETSSAPSAPASSSSAAAPQVDSSPVTAPPTTPSFTAAASMAAAGASAEPASPLAGTSCDDSAAPEPGWTPPPAPDGALCRLVTSGSVSFHTTSSGAPSTHVVLRGDTLWSIAASRLPADAPAEEIAAAVDAWIDANPSLAQHPDLLDPGDILQAPTYGPAPTGSQVSPQTDSAVQR